MTIHYEFPHNISLDEVKQIVLENPSFYIGERDGYIVANYLVSGSATHPPVVDRKTAIMRELRGLMFDHDGNLISRRFQKFFNFGEREDVMSLDLSKPHTILEKLDGSMITPVYINDTIRWCTKMGVTDVASQAEAFVAANPNYAEFAESLLPSYTPIFEWCSRSQRIVIDYPEDQLVLVAIRDVHYGLYVVEDLVEKVAKDYDIPVVQALAPMSNLDDFIVELRKREDIEGVVIRFDDGHMIKIKTDAYITLHRAKSLLENERDVVECVLTDKVDDLLAILPDTDKYRLIKFRDDVIVDINTTVFKVNLFLNILREDNVSRKQFSVENPKLDPMLRMFIFKHWGDDCTYQSVSEYALRNLGSNRSFEKLKTLFIAAKWKEVKVND
jgi:RNA ligase